MKGAIRIRDENLNREMIITDSPCVATSGSRFIEYVAKFLDDTFWHEAEEKRERETAK